MAAEDIVDDTQITCRFITKLPREYRVPGASVAVPSKLTRYGLSQIINHLLGLDTPKPFDFLVNGELVRQSLEKFLLAKSISAESVLDVEYVFAVEPPKAKQDQPHDDWVSGVAVRGDFIISGCYDGVVRCFQGTEERSSTRLHSGPIKAVAVLPEDQGPLVLTAGQDHTVQLVHMPALDGGPNSSQNAAAVAVYRDHTDAVASVAPSPQGTLFVSSSWDSTLRVWPTGASVAQAARDAAAEEPEAARTAGTKRRKDDAGEATPSAAVEHRCQLELSGHSQCASSVAWPSTDTIISGSWDHSVRRWDAESAVNVDTFNGSKAVYSVAAAPDGGGLLAFGGAERALHVWDPRTPVGQETSQKLYASHTEWISAVAWHPTSAHHVATASYDKTVKLWDLRTHVPLHTLQGHTDKVLCVAWARDDLVSGGADCTVRSYSVAV